MRGWRVEEHSGRKDEREKKIRRWRKAGERKCVLRRKLIVRNIKLQTH